MTDPNCIYCRHPRSEHVIVKDDPGVIPPTYRGRCLHKEITLHDEVDRTKIMNLAVTAILCNCKMYRTVGDAGVSLMEDAVASLMERVLEAKVKEYERISPYFGSGDYSE